MRCASGCALAHLLRRLQVLQLHHLAGMVSLYNAALTFPLFIWCGFLRRTGAFFSARCLDAAILSWRCASGCALAHMWRRLEVLRLHHLAGRVFNIDALSRSVPFIFGNTGVMWISPRFLRCIFIHSPARRLRNGSLIAARISLQRRWLLLILQFTQHLTAAPVSWFLAALKSFLLHFFRAAASHRCAC